jgi:two-component system OmpR family response regulator
MAVLVALMDHPRQVLTRADLLQAMGRDDGDVFDRTVDVLVSRLRKKLERDALHPEIVQTVRGGGYYFGAVVEWDTESLPVHERSVNKMND